MNFRSPLDHLGPEMVEHLLLAALELRNGLHEIILHVLDPFF